MSSIAVNAITDANGGNTTSINSVTPNAYNTVGKNLIINGAMQIAQRGTSASTLSGSNTFKADRFFGFSNVGTTTYEVASDAPTGFVNSVKYTQTSGGTIASTSYLALVHRLEGHTTSHLDWGSADAKTITFSFWVKSSVTGSFSFSCLNGGTTHSYLASYTVNTANTWEKKTITIDGPTVGTWATDNTNSLQFFFNLGYGSTYTNSTANTWQASGYYGLSTDTNTFASTTNATWQITGVQLEVGESATEFEHRPYGTELSLCQRYYQFIDGAEYSNEAIWSSFGASYNYVNWQFKVKMRTQPTIAGLYAGTGLMRGTSVATIYTAGSNWASFGWNNSGGGTLGICSADAEL
jgi:hypothetical protein